MAEHRKAAAGPGEDPGRTALLTGLTDVDLRTLRARDDPGLLAAVAEVLRAPAGPTDVWYVGEDPAQPSAAPAGPDDRTFPAGRGAPAEGEGSRG